MLTFEQARALEALTDERIGPDARALVLPEVVAELEAAGFLEPDARARTSAELDAFRTGRPIEWAARTVSQGDVLADFARHCRDELDDIDVVAAEPARLVLRWRHETSAVELRAGFVACERLASETPTLLLGDVEGDLRSLVDAFVADPTLRARLAVCDLARLEKLNAVRASAFVYFEWFLRDAYGVKLLPAAAFTQGLIDRGVISLGMG
jgi:hypothetical protein